MLDFLVVGESSSALIYKAGPVISEVCHAPWSANNISREDGNV